MNEETIAGVVGWGRRRRLHRQLDHRRSVRAWSRAPRRRQERRRSTPCSAPARCMAASPTGEGDPPPGRLADCAMVTSEPVGRALVEAGDQRDGQRAVRLHRLISKDMLQQRRDPPLLRPPRQRGDPRRPGARLRAGGNPAPRSRDHRPCRRRRRGGDASLRRAPSGGGGRPAAASIGRRWARTW